MKMMIRVLRRYENSSGQLINLEKSAFYVHEKVNSRLIGSIKRLTNIKHGAFPFTYLGCPIFYGRNKTSHYDSVIKKVGKRIQVWQGKMLSFGGRAVLISHVLQSIPIHLLSALSPPKGVIRQIHMMLNRFF
uniref:Putative ovule protein n=1 Tax=Solanum chacoense TaxID=4108 RepID=A0A0V0I3Q5_SOLCH